MTFLADVGLLALGSRFRAISDQLYSIADEVYRLRGIPIQGRWFPLLRLIDDQGPQSVGSIASHIGQTHSAVSQLADRLVADGWLAVTEDPADRRRRCLSLTEQSRQAIRQARPAWKAIIQVLQQRCAEAGIDVLHTLDRFERVLDGDLGAAIAEQCSRNDKANVQVVGFDPSLREHFYRLNADWLRKYFYLEEIDHRVLSDPEGEILAGGGEVLFAVLDGQVLGTCALKQESPGVFELTKMAVDESLHGLGIGRRLLARAIDVFRERGGKTFFLESSTKLTPALRLYESMGFRHQPSLKPDSHYSRSDVYMIWDSEEAQAVRRESELVPSA
ncbi:bifunctional helix-turn-helix transcriptional regulator/GNAT family N-acetyltransferase [Tahibacter sp. P2K]|uniref:Bifunctional helix-turn-helix transcriptional regulator/GNAT family N-acetyltransferase n=1 Tax=Tahibacter harae TaxID=2963937 RepID=A0ABT1QYG3_9GAMM|nr:bifunctional helix-turn-helix transcriptional regulator/GNAT family N-acetyltransferase [Tahibacter harae]MCQ4167334.1 bifunctional helix-turn-helix transcriptional regulator/GNAT family N-acetyltransferase [Tahibacter harae]